MRSVFETLVNHISHRRITAMVLAIAMVISVLYFGPSRADAADEISYTVTESMTITPTTKLMASDGEEHTISELSYIDIDPNVTCTIAADGSQTVAGSDNLLVMIYSLDAKLVVNAGATLKCDRIAACANIENRGTILANSIVNGDEESGDFINYGTVKTGTYETNSINRTENYGTFQVTDFNPTSIQGQFVNDGTVIADTALMNVYKVECRENSVFQVKESVTLEQFNSVNIGTIRAEEDTVFYSDGGTFYLEVEGHEPTLASGVMEGVTAASLLLQTPEFEGDMEDQICGVSYDALDYVTCTSDGTLTATYYEANPEDEDDMTLIGTTAPKEVGSYRVVYSVPKTDEYEAAEYSCDYAIDYLDMSVSACQVSGTKADEQYNGYDVFTDKVTFTAPEGYQIMPTSVEAEAFSDTFVLEEDGYYDGLIAQYRRKSDGAITESKYAYNASFYVNAKAPQLDHVWDQDDNELTLNAENTYQASSVYIHFKDALNIKSIKVNGVTVTDSENNGPELSTSLTMTGLEDETFAVEVLGQSGKTAEYSITLQNVLMDAPDDAYTIDGTEGDGGVYTSDVVLRPAEGYLIASSLGGDYQESLAYTTDITKIWLKHIDSGRYTSEVAVASIPIDKQAPVIKARLSMNGDFVQLNDGDDLNFKSMMLYVTDPEQNLASFSINGEQAIGISPYGRYETIDASKSTKETDTLVAKDKAGNTTTITISYQDLRQDAECTLTVPDYEAGGTFSPVLTTDHDLKDQVKYTFNDGIHDNFTETIPTAVGEYEVRAYIPASDTYNEIEIYEYFDVTKKSPTLSISVADIDYGGTLAPEIENNTSLAAKVEYKLRSEEDDAYTETKPTMPGLYTARVSVVETEEYQAASEVDDFEIRKLNDTSASVTIPDVTVGQEYAPTLTTVSNGKASAEFFYKQADEDDSQYTKTPPTAAGTYQVVARVPETEIYLAVNPVHVFKILKKTPTKATITVEDLVIDDELTPVVDTDSDGEKVVEYKKADAADTTYDETPPTASGTYMARLTVRESETYEEIVSEPDEFTISKKTVSATVEVSDCEVGDTITPKVTTVSDGKEDTTFKYKLETDPVEAYDGDVPTAAGTYMVLATVPETNNFKKIECTDTFTIKKKTAASATVTVADIEWGGTITPVITSDSDGKDDPTYKYKLQSQGEGDYSTDVPTAIGDYDILAILAETETYLPISCEGSFSITRKTVSATVTVENVEFGGTISPVVETESDGKKDTTFEYKLQSQGEEDYTGEVPTAVGDYDIRATVPQTANYFATTAESQFKITKNTVVSATVSVEDIYVGGTLNPVVETVSDGKSGATFEYKLQSQGVNQYDGTVPTAAGDYNIRATIPATASYEEIICTGTFSILKKTPTYATVTVADIEVGESPAPSTQTDSDGTATYTYKKTTDTAYSATVPTAAGEYDICATIPETATYNEIVCYGSFKINRKTPTLSLTVGGDIQLDETLYIHIETDSDGKADAKYEYRKMTDTTYQPSQPNALGEYEIRVTIPRTDSYESVSDTETFKILKKTYYGSVDAGDVDYGEPLEIDVDTKSDGRRQAKYEYKKSTEPTTAYAETEPTEVGEYSVRVTVPETDTYYKETYETTFRIRKAQPESSLTVANIEFGGTLKPELDTDSDGTVTYQYKQSGEAESAYSTAVPTEVGSYDARAVIAETAHYLADEVTTSFTITKTIVTANVTIEDIKVGGTLSPVVETVSNGAVSYEYKKTTDSTYGTEVPTAAGEYDFRATIAETTDYEEIVCIGSFRIVKKTTTATLIVDDILVGGKVRPKVDTVSDGKVTIEYRSTDDDASAYTEKVPTAAGEYDVRATVAETATYKAIVCTGGFRIRKKTATGTLTVKDIVEGGKVDPFVSTDSDGKITFKYKKVSDTTYTTDVPTEAGEYDVCAMVSATATYKAFECYGSFTITKKKVPEKKTATLTVSIEDCEVGDKVAPKVKTNSDGTPKIEYKRSAEDNSAYSEVKPTKAGTYSIRVTVPETATYKKIAYTGTFTISKKRPMLSVSLSDVYRGTGYTPATATDSDGRISFMYKAKTAADSAYSEEKPTAVGEYMVLAAVAETETYRKATAVAEFAIRYLSKPDEDCNPEGEEGENGYYTSDVYLDAPDGYLISAARDGQYAARIPYTPGMTVYYLKRVSDGALTDTVQIPGEIKIDKLLPETGTLLDQDGNPINTNGLAYADSVRFTISDENLASVTVNGMPVSIINHVAEVILNPGNDTVTFKILAKDIAGNGVEIGITVAATWIREGIVPEGTPLPLKTGKAYTMPAGAWITDSNDGMTYSGNRQFYVRVSQDYTFTKSK